MYIEVPHLGQHRALHDRSALIVLDVPNPLFAIERDFFGEPLFLEIADSIIIGIGEEVVDRRVDFPNVILERVHQVRAVPLHA
jgi:hypothetical protein